MRAIEDYINALPEFFQTEDPLRSVCHVDEIPGVDNTDDMLLDIRHFLGRDSGSEAVVSRFS